MTYLKRMLVLQAIIAVMILVACSGGEGGTGATEGDISRGQITGFGSIFVNGVEFETVSSAISLDGVAGAETDLRLGMVVTVNGTINADGLTGTADSVSVEEVIQGLVLSNDNVNTLTVLNHTVELPSNVRFDGVDNISGITAMADFVEVSGYVVADGVISATRVELLGSGETESGLLGTLNNLDTGLQTFEIGPALTVNYAAAELSDFPNNQIANNLYVKVEGAFDFASGVLTANSVEHKKISTGDVDEMEIEGFVTNVISATNFVINDVTVQTDTTTVFDGGAADEIVAGMFIEVEGSLVNGVLIAAEVEFDDGIRIEGEVDATAANTVTLKGMAGLIIQTDSLTDFDSALPGGIVDLVPGDRIRVRGFQENNIDVVARRIDVLSAGTDVSLQGYFTGIIAPESVFSISGVTVDTSSVPDNEFIVDDEVKTRSEFFSSLDSPEDIVEARGTLASGVITWDRVELID